ncbi:cell envelope integrity protein CreD [Marinifilum caeruleilacunae]|uniref:Cell envelope integrity protein CreD n=1 Tax=Marinifilum caeruleilacunae TaxID=2499076 RepID=A0ABX1WXA8_9BACT|nr:cell envelope integrity protein CreD [Marinifilum caeruleilacunae]NOU60747.1 cell envelope integrity protein CreD [Marinifilum caeruleilacunae]
MNTEQTPFEKFGNWLKQSVGLKLTTITILMLLLLIPTSMIKSIISERKNLNRSVLNEVSSKWANEQQINGPVLSIPLLYEYRDKENEVIQQTKHLYILPDALKINGDIEPKTLKRGIYEVVVYRSQLNVSGTFDLNAKIDKSGLKEIQFDKAFVSIGISDLRGIEDQIVLNWGKEKLQVQAGSRLPEMMRSGVSIDLPNLEEEYTKSVPFSFALNLQGSQNLSFIPVGGTTEVQLKSPWSSPSFNGNFIPKQREVSDEGFTAKWKALLLNRNYPQTWVDRNMGQRMQESSFGVDLIMPLDDYQKATRSAKYAVMTISLIFLVFFLVEILNGKKIHPFQYTLVGLALCLFYVLLISISEHSNFNMAYLISAGVSSLLISLYSTSVFKSLKFTGILTSTILGIYTFLFVTLQLADYALLMGSIGLTIILAITMYFTRNINWYKLQVSAE